MGTVGQLGLCDLGAAGAGQIRRVLCKGSALSRTNTSGLPCRRKLAGDPRAQGIEGFQEALRQAADKLEGPWQHKNIDGS